MGGCIDMIVADTPMPGVLVLEPRVFRDQRGFFLETYRQDALHRLGIRHGFVQGNQSRSVRNTLRGLHWQWRRPQAKLVRVVNGSIFDAVVDVRRDSPTFGRWCGVELSAENFRQLYVPEGFAHGFCVLSDQADVEYLCSDYYDPGGEAGLLWNDPAVNVEWPTSWPLLSEKDASNPVLASVDSSLLP
jgi:dTDP-4-dehydrorhamnose 3,5-epimerase